MERHGGWREVAAASGPAAGRRAGAVREASTNMAAGRAGGQSPPRPSPVCYQGWTASAMRPVATSSRISSPSRSLASRTACQRRMRSSCGKA